jgi:hypothetical protein
VLLPAISVSLKLRGFRVTQESLLRFLAHPQQIPRGGSARLLADGERTRLTVRMVNAAVHLPSLGGRPAARRGAGKAIFALTKSVTDSHVYTHGEFSGANLIDRRCWPTT